MFDTITEWFNDIDWNRAGIAIIIWAICLVVLWKFMYDPKFMKFYVKVILSVVMLPISYIIINVMGDR